MNVTSRWDPSLTVAAVLVGMALSGRPARAAGIDCTLAQSKVEQAICANPDLRTLDGKLNAAYAAALQRQPERKATLLRDQKAWLQRREACEGNTVCLRARYTERREALLAALSVPLDAVDAEAVRMLQQALEAQRAANSELSLEKALKPFALQQGTTFSNEGADSMTGATFPTRRPAGVSEDEWSALQRTGIDSGGENGMASYWLVDLDGNGSRDLVVDTYVGGTGLFNAVNIWLRKGARFVGLTQAGQSLEGPDDFYTLNGRGSNQQAYWLQLQGRVYLAYAEGAYGHDELSLLRPVGYPSEVAQWTIHYRYSFSVPAKQTGEDARSTRVLSTAQLAALRKGLQTVDPSVAEPGGGGSGGGDSPPLCPPPGEATEDEIQAYRSAGPGHYSFEIVKDFPVWFGRECRIGRLVNWFGRYDENGLALQLWVAQPGREDSQETYQVSARRQVIRIEGGRLGGARQR